ncbi:MAG: succinylglutamate-semialdehyde dehydrogenase [Sphingomonadaceae bacterium]
MSETLKSIDPATGELVWEGAMAGETEVRTAVNRAHRAFPGWAATPLAVRIALVEAFKGALDARRDELARIISLETGKPAWEAQGEVGSMIAKVDVSIRAQAERAGERRSDMPFGEAVLRHNPQGVMAVFGPYNFPGHLPNGHIVPALLAGNTVVFKPSEITPATGEMMAQAWEEVGLPKGVFNIVQGARETGAALAEAEIDGLLFTGSAATGMHFRRMFAERPRVILALELGGNNPLVAWDGDIDEVAATVVQSAYITTGQRCSCARRLIVSEGKFGDDLVEAIAALADRLRIGAWDSEPAPYMGPLVSSKAANAARSAFKDLTVKGAKTIRAMGQPEGLRTSFVTPALLDVTGVEVPDEEVFAPMLQVRRVADFDAALAAANDTRFGLSAGFIGEDDAMWQRFVREVRAGVVNRNRPTTGAAGLMPFGGTGDSGNHRPGAYYAADYCAYPVASFEAGEAAGAVDSLEGYLT